MSDALFDGRRIRVLTIVDNFSRVSPAMGVAQGFKATDVVAVLDRAVKRHGTPKTIRVDNGPEFVSRELDLWAYTNKIVLDFSRPGKPTDNAFIEAFNSRVRAECLNQHWFLSLQDAKEKVGHWWREYNLVRPHSAIGNLTPAQFARDHQKPGRVA